MAKRVGCKPGYKRIKGKCVYQKPKIIYGSIDNSGTFSIQAKEPGYNLIHVWQGFPFNKARNVALDLAKNKWREVTIKKED